MKQEALEKCDAASVSERLVDELLVHPVQEVLFEEVNEIETGRRRKIEELKSEASPENIVIEAGLVDYYRYLAAFYGAGFHRSEYQNVSYIETGEQGVSVDVMPLLGLPVISQLQPRRARHNKMWDEVTERLFTDIAPATSYDEFTDTFITSLADLKKVFASDYRTLRNLRTLGFDLLYEGKG